ncbi:MAG: Bax inhibitor-1 family protein [Flavobacteriaceae bacterium]
MEHTQDLFINLEATEKATFYKKTYTHVALALVAFIGVEAMMLKSEPLVKFMLSLTQGYLWLALLGGFWLATNFAEKLAHNTSRQTQYLGLAFYVVAEAIIFVPMIYIAMHYSSPQVIQQAGLVSVFLFVGLSAVALMSTKDFSFLKSALTIGFFIAIGLIVTGILFGFDLGLWFSVLMIVIAAGTILYQTSQLKYEYQPDQYVGAAVGLFASFMLLFWYVLRIFMSRD